MISTMAQIVVRDLEESVKQRLKRRAQQHGRSMEEEVRQILRNAVREEGKQLGLGSQIAARFAGIGLKEGELPEMEDQPPRAPKFRR
jgi:plasmid stability protein